jgi:ribose 5-phosphate isomerase B
MAMIYIGADHRGYDLKRELLDWLRSNGYEAQDCGAIEYNKDDDFVDFALKVANEVAGQEGKRGVLICGSGAGVEIAANKVHGIRCGLGLNPEQVKHIREADDINILALASDYTSGKQAADMMETFLKTEYDPAERHERRLNKIKNLE